MNILCLSTYPSADPVHGGQHRAHNIVLALRAAGHAVQVCGVMGSSGFGDCEGFVPYPSAAALTRASGESPQLEELLIGDLFAADDTYFNALVALIKPAPELVVVEQPWMARFAARYVKTLAPGSCKILYSSHNVEHDMKFDIIRHEQGLAAAEAARLKVLACEVAAIESADLVACVAQSDLDWTRGLTSVPCVLAPNGVADHVVTEGGRAEALAITGGGRFALYCASAHPPNMQGFFDSMGPSIGAIAPDQHIVIAGGAGPAIVADTRYAEVGSLARCCIAPGPVSAACLQGLLAAAQVIILPITAGGGTNLKTAEALWSGKHVVATSKALRGYEAYADAQGLCIADGPPAFLNALRGAMQSPPLQLSADERERRKDVLWQATLAPMVAAVGELCRVRSQP